MAYTLRAWLSTETLLQQVATRWNKARVVLLKQGMAIIPVSHALYDEHHLHQQVEKPYVEFDYLTTEMIEHAVEISAIAPIAYIEAEYFGGIGTQAAILWEARQLKLGPLHSEQIGPIDTILKYFGVVRENEFDEFYAVGLQKHRHTDEWLSE